jgi:hypothetical protein
MKLLLGLAIVFPFATPALVRVFCTREEWWPVLR